jgi:hypothetical protein
LAYSSGNLRLLAFELEHSYHSHHIQELLPCDLLRIT